MKETEKGSTLDPSPSLIEKLFVSFANIQKLPQNQMTQIYLSVNSPGHEYIL